jgi:formylglycine-generating enzyme required for sulfatase activity
LGVLRLTFLLFVYAHLTFRITKIRGKIISSNVVVETMENSYFNFDLVIERLDDRYRARVIDSPAGTASTEFDRPLSDLQLENYILRMGQTRQGKRLPFESTELQAVKRCGESLFDAVFANDVYACYLMSWEMAREQNKGLRVRLHIEVAEFHDYPWELLYNSKTKQFLALSNDTPIVRFFELPFPEQPLFVETPIKILVMISSPEGFPPLNVDDEWDRLESAFGPLIERGLVVLERLPRPTLGELQKALRRDQFHVFHFIGHGKFVVHKQDGVLLLEEELNGRGRPVSGQYLGVLLHDHQCLRMVVLNACEGARTSQSDPYAGVAQALVQQGIPAVIAMQFPIFEDSAIEFAYEFYGAIADGFPVDASISEARKAIFTSGNETEWATPVLFMNSPDGQIFDLHSTQQVLPLDAPFASEPLTEEPVPVEDVPQQPERPRKRTGTFWSRLALGLALAGLAVIVGLWMFSAYALPKGAPIASTYTPTSTATLTALPPTSTVTSTPSPTATFTLTPTPTATPYPDVIRDSKTVEMVLIPAGEFAMGSEEGYIDEKPVHTVYMDNYYIDKYEVTNGLYELCVQLNVCTRPIDVSSYQRLSYFGDPLFTNYPVINVTIEMARTYCEDWRGASLPTEAEWEKAARGSDAPTFPWGEEINCNLANYRDKSCKRIRDTVPVTSFPEGASEYGVYNMAGNVWEWVKDWYSPAYYLNSPYENPTGPENAVVGIYYIKRGGSYQDEWEKLRSANREKNDPTNYGSNLGFRCVRPISDDFP